MAKVSFVDKRILKKFLEITSISSGTVSAVVLFVDIPVEWKLRAGWAFLMLLALTYLVIWIWSNNLTFMNLGDAPDDERNLRVEVPG